MPAQGTRSHPYCRTGPQSRHAGHAQNQVQAAAKRCSVPTRSIPRASAPLLVVHIIISAPPPPTAAERAAPAPTAAERPKRPPPLDPMWQAHQDPPYGARQSQAADAAQRVDDVCRPRAALLLLHLPRARAAELSLSEDFRRDFSLFPWASELREKT